MGAHRGQRSGTPKALGACLLAVVVMGLAPASSESRVLSGAQTVKAVTAKRPCPLAPANVPCHGTTIESAYAYYGYKEGDISLISVKLGPERKVGTTYVSAQPVPGMYEVIKRTFTWHSVASIEIVAVYEVEVVGRGFRHKKLPSGKHSGHATITDAAGGSSPILLLQGRHAQATQSLHSLDEHRTNPSASVPATTTPAATAKTHCQYPSVGGPCAPIMSIYTYFGYHEGDLSLIRAKLSPNQIVGHVHKTWPTPGEYEVNQRTFTWHSVPSVEIVGVYIQRGVGKGFSYTKLPTGKHSGHAKLTAVTDGSTPSLVLQGRRI